MVALVDGGHEREAERPDRVEAGPLPVGSGRRTSSAESSTARSGRSRSGSRWPTADIAHPGLFTVTLGVEIICVPTDDAIAAWQTRTHGPDPGRATNSDSPSTRSGWPSGTPWRGCSCRRSPPTQKRPIIRSELKRTALAVLTNQNFSGFNATRLDSLGLPYPDAGATVALSAYIRFFEQAVEWDHLEYAFFARTSGARGRRGRASCSARSRIRSSPSSWARGPLGSCCRSGRVTRSPFETFLNTGRSRPPTSCSTSAGRCGRPRWPSCEDRGERTAGRPRSATRGSSGSPPISCAPAGTNCSRSGR